MPAKHYIICRDQDGPCRNYTSIRQVLQRVPTQFPLPVTKPIAGRSYLKITFLSIANLGSRPRLVYRVGLQCNLWIVSGQSQARPLMNKHESIANRCQSTPWRQLDTKIPLPSLQSPSCEHSHSSSEPQVGSQTDWAALRPSSIYWSWPDSSQYTSDAQHWMGSGSGPFPCCILHPAIGWGWTRHDLVPRSGGYGEEHSLRYRQPSAVIS